MEGVLRKTMSNRLSKTQDTFVSCTAYKTYLQVLHICYMLGMHRQRKDVAIQAVWYNDAVVRCVVAEMISHKTFGSEHSKDRTTDNKPVYSVQSAYKQWFAQCGMRQIRLLVDERRAGKRTTSHCYVKHKIVVDDIFTSVRGKHFAQFVAHNTQTRQIASAVGQVSEHLYGEPFGLGRNDIQTAEPVGFDRVAIVHKLVDAFDAPLLLYGVNNEYDSRFAHVRQDA